MEYEAHIQGQLVYLKSFQTVDGVVYVNINTGLIEQPTHVNPMKLSQKNMLHKKILMCRLPEITNFEKNI